MLDFRSIIVPRFVYATGRDFEDDSIRNETVAKRIQELARTLQKLATRLRDP